METTRLTLPSILTYFTLLVVSLTVLTGASEGTKRLDCQSFCKKTGFNGRIGGCSCGYTLFSYKRAAPMVTPGGAAEDASESSSSPNEASEVDLLRGLTRPRPADQNWKASDESDSDYLWRPYVEVLRIPRPENSQKRQWKKSNGDSDIILKSFV